MGGGSKLLVEFKSGDLNDQHHRHACIDQGSFTFHKSEIIFPPALRTPGYWRLLDLDYRDQVFQRVLTLLEEEDWSYRRVPLNAACQKLEELEPG